MSDEFSVKDYGKNYNRWKGWAGDTFGKIERSQIFYFNAEMRKTGLMASGAVRVLEIGFGNGSFLSYAKAKGWDICGTEISADLVEAGKRAGFNCLQADNVRDFPDDAFDLVVAFDVLEHVPPDQLEGFLQEIKRILRPSGVCVARFPNGDSPFGMYYQNGDMTHISVIGSGKVRFLAKSVGVTLVDVDGEAQAVFGGGMKSTLRNLVRIPTKRLINALVNFIFFPKFYARQDVAFCSSNLVMVLRADKQCCELNPPVSE